MTQEGELADDIVAAKFRDDFFLHAYATQNPKLYHELFDEPDVPEDWEVPRTTEDLQAMLAELAQVGVDVNAGTDF
jgi:hypothetical protein